MIRILRNPNIHYPKTVPALSQINSVRATTKYSLKKIHFFPSGFPTKILYANLLSLVRPAICLYIDM